MKTIFISSFTANPAYGSEFAVGWNIPLELSKLSKYNIHLFIGTFDGGGFGKFDGLNDIDLPTNFIIHRVKSDWLVRLLNIPNQYFGLGFFFYLALRRWHILVYKEALKVARMFPPDLTHQLGPIGFREPGCLYRLEVPHVWGPIGGANTIFLPGLKSIGFYYWKSLLKNLLNHIQLRSHRVQQAVTHSNFLLFSTSENLTLFNSIYNTENKSKHVRETAFKGCVSFNEVPKIGGLLRCIVVGSLTKRKNVEFLLDVFAGLPKCVSLTVVGYGKESERLRRYVEKCSLNVVFVGSVPYEQVVSHYKSADILLLPSHAEGNTNVLFEALSNGVPVMAFNRSGMKDTLEKCGFLMKNEAYDLAVISWRNQIMKILADRELLNEKSRLIKSYMSRENWESRAKNISEVYDNITG